MNLKSIIKKILTNACVYFSIITAIYAVVVMIVYVDDTSVLLDASRVLLFFVASLLFACANGIFGLAKLPSPAKLLIHYLLSLFAFYSCMMLPISPDPSVLLVGLSLFSVFYFILAALIALFTSRYKARENKTTEYKSQFKKN